MRRAALLLGAVALLAGCGGGTHRPTPRQPHLSRALAGPWRAQADGVAAALAAGDACLAQQRALQLQLSVIGAVNHRLVPPRFQEQLVSAVNDLTGRIRCVAPAPTPEEGDATGNGHGKDHGHGHGHDKHGGGD